MYIQPPTELPHRAVYHRKLLRWNNDGSKYFVHDFISVMVLKETDKRYNIQFIYDNGVGFGETKWVKKSNVQFDYLNDKDFCLRKNRRMPPTACRICYERCWRKGKDYPTSY